MDRRPQIEERIERVESLLNRLAEEMRRDMFLLQQNMQQQLKELAQELNIRNQTAPTESPLLPWKFDGKPTDLVAEASLKEAFFDEADFLELSKLGQTVHGYVAPHTYYTVIKKTDWEFQKTVQGSGEHPEKFGMSLPKGDPCYDPLSCGKVLLDKAIASECQANFVIVQDPELLTMRFEESKAKESVSNFFELMCELESERKDKNPLGMGPASSIRTRYEESPQNFDPGGSERDEYLLVKMGCQEVELVSANNRIRLEKRRVQDWEENETKLKAEILNRELVIQKTNAGLEDFSGNFAIEKGQLESSIPGLSEYACFPKVVIVDAGKRQVQDEKEERKTGYCRILASCNVIDVPLVARKLHKSKEDMRRELGIQEVTKDAEVYNKATRFKSVRWKSDKNKVKVVFKLQNLLIPEPVVKDLQAITDLLAAEDRLEKCVNIYAQDRVAKARCTLQALNLDYLEIQLSAFVTVETVEEYIEQWDKHMMFAVKFLLQKEYRFCRGVYQKFGSDVWMNCFATIANSCGFIEILNFGCSICKCKKIVVGTCEFFSELLEDENCLILKRVLEIYQVWNQVRFHEGVFMTQIHSIIKALESNLDTWTKRYEYKASSYLFMMNNYWYLCISIKGSKLGDLMGNSWLQTMEEFTECYAEQYIRESWGKLLLLLSEDGLILFPGGRAIDQDLVKKRISAFYEAFDDMHKNQSRFTVSEKSLRWKIHKLIVEIIVPTLKRYLQRYMPMQGTHMENSLKYNAKDAYLLEQQVMDMHSELEIYKRDKGELEMQMEQLALDYEIMKQESHEMAYKLQQSQLQEQLKMPYEWPSPYASTQELEGQIAKLEDKLKLQSSESEDSSRKIMELETHAKTFQDKLQKQAKGFETDLEALMRCKVEQEQRAVRAEEALRKTRLHNANTAERLQEEFRRLSMQLGSTCETNEIVASTFLVEANALRLQKICSEEMITKIYGEQQAIKDHYETRLEQLVSQASLMKNEKKRVHAEIEGRELPLEQQKRDGEVTKMLLLSDAMLKLEEPSGLPPVKGVKHSITLIPGALPRKQVPYRSAHYKKDEIEIIVKELLSTDQVSKSHSPYATPVLLVKKKDGGWLLCVDYRYSQEWQRMASITYFRGTSWTRRLFLKLFARILLFLILGDKDCLKRGVMFMYSPEWNEGPLKTWERKRKRSKRRNGKKMGGGSYVENVAV